MDYPQAMATALQQAQVAAQKGEVPIGATLYDATGQVLASAHNLTETEANPLAHAEMLVLQQALQTTGKKYLTGTTLAVTLEPCAMCIGAICAARVGTVIFGATDPKSGGTVSGARVQQHSHHSPQIIGGILEAESQALLQTFFQSLRS